MLVSAYYKLFSLPCNQISSRGSRRWQTPLTASNDQGVFFNLTLSAIATILTMLMAKDDVVALGSAWAGWRRSLPEPDVFSFDIDLSWSRASAVSTTENDVLTLHLAKFGRSRP